MYAWPRDTLTRHYLCPTHSYSAHRISVKTEVQRSWLWPWLWWGHELWTLTLHWAWHTPGRSAGPALESGTLSRNGNPPDLAPGHHSRRTVGDMINDREAYCIPVYLVHTAWIHLYSQAMNQQEDTVSLTWLTAELLHFDCCQRSNWRKVMNSYCLSNIWFQYA